MKHWMTRIATIGAATAIIGLWLPISSANAAAGGVLGRVHFAPDNLTSPGQAGYLLSPAPATATAKDKFKVPTVTGCTATLTAVAFGNLIFASSGAAETGGLVVVGCSGGSPFYEDLTLVNGAQTSTPIAVAPGNVIKVKAKESATAASAKLTDVTTGMSDSGSAATGATNGVVLDGVETLVSGSSALGIPNFGTVKFTGGSIDGATVGASGAAAYNLNATGSQVQIKTSALTGGTAWTEKWIHA